MSEQGKPLRCEIIHDNFQNYKKYNVPKAQLVIADIPYNIGADAYGSNPMWYKGGDNANGEASTQKRAFLIRTAILDLFELRLQESFPNCKASATKQGLTVLRLMMSADCTRERESLTWPRPTTGAPLCGGTHNFRQMVALRDAGVVTEEERKNLTCGSGGKSNPALMEWLMGFQIGWKDLNASETP